MTMTLDDRRNTDGGYPLDEIEQLRASFIDLRSVVTRMGHVLDRMEEQQKQQEGGSDA